MSKIQAVNLNDYEILARDAIEPVAFAYYSGGANDELTMQDNISAYDRIKLYPRILVDVSQRDLSTTVLGQTWDVPFMVAPMALAKLAHPDGELGVARAAAKFGVPIALSTLSTTSLETVAAEASTPLWFQLYVYQNRDINKDLIQRAKDAGYGALVITVDAPLPGKRTSSRRSGFSLPDGVTLENLTGYDFRGFSLNTSDTSIAADAVSQIAAHLTWDDLDWMASLTDLPVLLKGVLHPADARLVKEHGAAGVIISNHGGRQLDTTPAAIDVLPRIRQAVGAEMSLLVDGGVRRGTDIVKSIALGANAVMVGRPVFYGLGVAGQAGVEDVFNILRDELDTALALVGCPNLRDLNTDVIFS